MTKAAQILDLHAKGHTTRVIAGIVYGLDDDLTPQSEWDKRVTYCRVVVNQRKGSGMSEFDRRYAASEAGRNVRNARLRTRYHSDPVYRAKSLASATSYQRRKRAEAKQLA